MDAANDPFHEGPPLDIAAQLLYGVIDRLLKAAAQRGSPCGYILLHTPLHSTPYFRFSAEGHILTLEPRYGIPERRQMEIRARWFDCSEDRDSIRWTVKPEYALEIITCFQEAVDRNVPT